MFSLLFQQLAIVTIVQGLFLVPATRNRLPSDIRLASNLASLALVIGIAGVLIGVASSRSFYARRETNSILLNDLLQFRSDLLLILEWNEGDWAVDSESTNRPSFQRHPSTSVLNFAGSNRTSVNIGNLHVTNQFKPSVPDRRERILRASFFLQNVQHHCCFRSERRIIADLLVVVRKFSTGSPSQITGHRNPASPSAEDESEHNNSARVSVTPVLFQALWLCLCLSSACFGTSNALFLEEVAHGEIFGRILRLSCFLIFPGVTTFLFFCQKFASPSSFSRTHSH